MARQCYASNFKPRFSVRILFAVLGILFGLFLGACKHMGSAAETSVLVVERAPRCKEIGLVDGEGGGADSAIVEAKRRASEKGATHMVLGEPELDIDDGLTTVVRGTLFDCPPQGSEFPPTGYP